MVVKNDMERAGCGRVENLKRGREWGKVRREVQSTMQVGVHAERLERYLYSVEAASAPISAGTRYLEHWPCYGRSGGSWSDSLRSLLPAPSTSSAVALCSAVCAEPCSFTAL